MSGIRLPAGRMRGDGVLRAVEQLATVSLVGEEVGNHANSLTWCVVEKRFAVSLAQREQRNAVLILFAVVVKIREAASSRPTAPT